MIKHTFTISDASADSYDDAMQLRFHPPTGTPRPMPPGVVLVAVMSGHPDDLVAVTGPAAATLAVELTRAFDIVPPDDLLALARGRDVVVPAGPRDATSPDSSDALLRRAMEALGDDGVGPVAENDRLRLAVDIARHLLSGEQR